MEDKYHSHKKIYNRQRIKTGLSKLLWIPYITEFFIKWIALMIGALFIWMGMKKLKQVIDRSSQKLLIQKENFKPIKKEYKMYNKNKLKQERENSSNQKGKENDLI